MTTPPSSSVAWRSLGPPKEAYGARKGDPPKARRLEGQGRRSIPRRPRPQNPRRSHHSIAALATSRSCWKRAPWSPPVRELTALYSRYGQPAARLRSRPSARNDAVWPRTTRQHPGRGSSTIPIGSDPLPELGAHPRAQAQERVQDQHKARLGPRGHQDSTASASECLRETLEALGEEPAALLLPRIAVPKPAPDRPPRPPGRRPGKQGPRPPRSRINALRRPTTSRRSQDLGIIEVRTEGR